MEQNAKMIGTEQNQTISEHLHAWEREREIFQISFNGYKEVSKFSGPCDKYLTHVRKGGSYYYPVWGV